MSRGTAPVGTASTETATRFGALGYIARLLTVRGRNRADLCYEFLGTRNCPAPDSTFLNLGYWRAATEYRAAAEAMVDLLGEAAAIKEGDTVLDAGCGFGDQDVRLVSTRRPRRIIAINVTDVQLEHARLHNADNRIEYLKCSATSLPVEGSSIDAVISLEAAFHFDTRESFLHEAFRVLRGGGRLAVLDLLPLEKGGRVMTGGIRGSIERWAGQVPAANVYGITEYRRILGSCGFEKICTESIAADVFPGYLNHLRHVLEDREAARRLYPFVRRAMGHAMRRARNPYASSDYVLVTAERPEAAKSLSR